MFYANNTRGGMKPRRTEIHSPGTGPSDNIMAVGNTAHFEMIVKLIRAHFM